MSPREVLSNKLSNAEILEIVDRHIYRVQNPNYWGLIEEMLERKVCRSQSEQILRDVREGVY
jgi:hypothetical protein